MQHKLGSMDHDKYLKPVIKFAERVLKDGRDRWHNTPLLADGIDSYTGKPIPWNWGGKDRAPSNLACQQNLMRVLVGLTHITGDAKYKQTALAATRHTLLNLKDARGLLYWGGHVAWDMIHQEKFGHAGPEDFHHELKTNFPWYRFMYEADPAHTAQAIRAIWDAQIHDWQILDLSRHGAYDKPQRVRPIWTDEYKPGEPFFVGEGLSFINAGSDLILAAAELAVLNAEPGARLWARRLADRYIQIRDPQTGLGGYQFSQIPGDRAQKQFGPELGPNALEGTMLDAGHCNIRYGTVAVCMLDLGQRLGVGPGDFFTNWALDDLRAHQRHVYDSTTGLCSPMMTSGRKLTPDDIKRPGYYKARAFVPYAPASSVIWAYAKAALITGEKDFGRSAIRMLADRKVLGQGSTLDRPVPCDCRNELDPTVLFTLLELYRIKQDEAYLTQAKFIGDNIIRQRFHRDVFLPTERNIYTCFDYVEPLALLHLAGQIMGKSDGLPNWACGKSDFTAEHPAAVGKNPWNRIGIDTLLYSKVRAE
jgi:pectate lyase